MDLLLHYQTCLGGPFPEPPPLDPVVRETISQNGYQRVSVTYAAEPDDRVPALLLIQEGVSASHPAPAVCVWHQHNDQYQLGKAEPAGLAGDPTQHVAVALVREGYVVLCPDALGFEERQDPAGRLSGSDYERFLFLWYVVRGQSLAWKAVLDIRRAVDYLCSRPDVLPDRIGCYGHSMGSTHAWLAGPLEPRLTCLVGNGCLPTYDAIEHERLLHCFSNFVPGWKAVGDTPDIAALIAPRPLHLNFGERDAGSPIDFVRKGLGRIAAAYEKAGVPEHFTSFIESGAGHACTPAMWEQTLAVFRRYLRR